MRVAISGASGLIGQALGRSLQADGHDVLRLVRSGTAAAEADTIRWDPAAQTIDAAALEGVDAVVHLAGAGIGEHRWTAAHKRAILDSRTQGTGLLARTLAGLDRPPGVLISASGVNFYGDRGDEVLTETSGPGQGFLTDVTQAWEQATDPAAEAGIRTVKVRSSVVLTHDGGALPEMARPFRFGVGGRLGSGRQWLSWISLTDHIAALRLLLDRDDIAGPVNLTAPNPVTNSDFTKALGRALHRPTLFAAPATAIRLLLGREKADELVLISLRVHPAVLEAAGFEFQHPDIDRGLQAA